MKHQRIGIGVGLRARPSSKKIVTVLLSFSVVALAVPALAVAPAAASGGGLDIGHTFVTTIAAPGRFPLAAGGRAATLVVSSADFPGVVRVVSDLQADIKSVTGVQPAISLNSAPAGDAVIVGTIGKSPLIDGLIGAHKIDVSGIAGKWETSLEQVVQNPLPGVGRALVIAGSDQRGTIYGVYEVSKEIGVSPWYYWDDVKPQPQKQLYVLPGRHSQGTPAVKYRGFFINDENPDTGTWAPETFGPGLATGYPGGLNHQYYAKVFEALLRLKGNYLWPAVWGRAFALDDPQNHATATNYGVVMGTSHEAPMMCGIEEWNRFATPGSDPYGGNGEWSFVRNAPALEQYWTQCIQRMVDQKIDGVVTLGMRGPGDVSLPDGDAIPLMESIIAKQREIIAQVTGKDPAETPQVWTLYKEVQRYWNKGMRPPDDVTVVFSDDNWGNMRQLPDVNAAPRSGGYGMYYHFDYVGGGRNYKWVDTVNLANTWEQLHAAYTYGVNRLWMFNVGDMKNSEAPLQFSLDYAWNPNAYSSGNLAAWESGYAAQNFGSKYAAAIADVLDTYGQLQSRRKPELLNRKITLDPTKNLSIDKAAVVYNDQASPFSLTSYLELDRAAGDWAQLRAKADWIGSKLPAYQQDAYYELVRYEVDATANLYALRNAEFTNLLYASQGRAGTNHLADVAEARFADDQAMNTYYNNTLAGGKWHDWQLQPHIDYGDIARYGPNAPWQQPELNNVALTDVLFPAVQRISLPATADMGVAIDGSDQWWPNSTSAAVLPSFSPYQTEPAQYIDVFNRGSVPFDYKIEAGQPWVIVSRSKGQVTDQVRATVSIDWRRAPKGSTEVPITISGPGGKTVIVKAIVQNPDVPRSTLTGFVEANGYVSMPADAYSRAVNSAGVSWKEIDGIGRTGDGMEPFPQTASPVTAGGGSPRLEYDMTLFATGQVTVYVSLSPRNDVLAHGGLQYAVSIDGAAPQIVNIATATGAADATMNRQWERNTSNNVNLTWTTHTISTAGHHVLKFWMVDPTVVLQNIVVDTGGMQDSYLGPPTSMRFSAPAH